MFSLRRLLAASLTARIASLAIVAVAAAGGAALVTGGLASGSDDTAAGAGSQSRAPRHSTRSADIADVRADAHFRLFARHLKLASTANAGFSAPTGAIRAYSQAGHEIYVWNPTESETPAAIRNQSGGAICVLRVDEVMSHTSCGNAAEVAELGIVSVERSRRTHVPGDEHFTIEALVPNSATSLTVTEPDGASHSVAVTNNVATVNLNGEDEELSTVSYRLPNGQTHTVDVHEGFGG